VSKKDSTNTVIEKENNESKEVDHNIKWKDARENLVMQLKDHLEKAEYHKMMATKAQGALEVNDQLFLEQNEENK
tara:strand:+ start:178 stop:402 length:225 start_codon:yes stop_codon:yes gene_type:complete